MKKYFFITIICVLSLLSITGCGEQAVAKEEISTGISAMDPIETPIETSVETPVAEEISLPNQESYWNLNYFDLKSYLLDCGAEEITEENDDLGVEISYLEAKFGDWYVDIYTDSYEQYANLYIHNIDSSITGFYKDFDYFDDKNNIVIIVDLDTGLMVHQATIKALPELIKALQESYPEKPQIEGYIYP